MKTTFGVGRACSLLLERVAFKHAEGRWWPITGVRGPIKRGDLVADVPLDVVPRDAVDRDPGRRGRRAGRGDRCDRQPPRHAARGRAAGAPPSRGSTACAKLRKRAAATSAPVSPRSTARRELRERRGEVSPTSVSPLDDERDGRARERDVVGRRRRVQRAEVDGVLRAGLVVAREQREREQVASVATGTTRPSSPSSGSARAAISGSTPDEANSRSITSSSSRAAGDAGLALARPLGGVCSTVATRT